MSALFTPVDPSELSDDRLSRRGHLNHSITEGFMNAGIKVAKLNREDTGKTTAYLYPSLMQYVRSRKLPIKLFQQQGELYLVRLDLNNDGSPIPGYKLDET